MRLGLIPLALLAAALLAACESNTYINNPETGGATPPAIRDTVLVPASSFAFDAPLIKLPGGDTNFDGDADTWGEVRWEIQDRTTLVYMWYVEAFETQPDNTHGRYPSAGEAREVAYVAPSGWHIVSVLVPKTSAWTRRATPDRVVYEWLASTGPCASMSAIIETEGGDLGGVTDARVLSIRSRGFSIIIGRD